MFQAQKLTQGMFTACNNRQCIFEDVIISLKFDFFQQPFESLHHNFKQIWTNYKRMEGHPDYPLKLKDAVVAFNSMNL